MRTIACFILGLLFTTPGTTDAQSTSPFVGDWAPVSITNIQPGGKKVRAFGQHPMGMVVFTSNGLFTWAEVDPALPPIAANNRNGGTANENKAIVQRSLFYFGSYTVDAAKKTITLHIDGSSYMNWKGVEQVRKYTLVGDTATFTNPTASVGGKAIAVLQRMK